MQNNSCHVSLRMQVSLDQSEDSFLEYPVHMILTMHIPFSLCCTSNRRTDRILVLKQSGYKKGPRIVNLELLFFSLVSMVLD